MINHIAALICLFITVHAQNHVTVSPGPCLWPPNHKFFSLTDFLNTHDYLTATDPANCPINYVEYVKCTQTESSGSSDDTDTCNYHSGDDVLCVLAERSGDSSSGRSYDIVLKVNVSCENELQQVTYTVTVPHDARRGGAKDCERGGKGYCANQPAPPAQPVVINNGQVTADEVSNIYSQKKQQIQSNTDDTLIVNNVMSGNNPVNVNGLGASTQKTETMFQYEIILSESVEDPTIDLIKETQSQVLALPVDRFTIATSNKRQAGASYMVSVNTDKPGLSSGAVAGIVIACIVVVAIIVAVVFRYRKSAYAPVQ